MKVLEDERKWAASYRGEVEGAGGVSRAVCKTLLCLLWFSFPFICLVFFSKTPHDSGVKDRESRREARGEFLRGDREGKVPRSVHGLLKS